MACDDFGMRGFSKLFNAQNMVFSSNTLEQYRGCSRIVRKCCLFPKHKRTRVHNCECNRTSLLFNQNIWGNTLQRYYHDYVCLSLFRLKKETRARCMWKIFSAWLTEKVRHLAPESWSDFSLPLLTARYDCEKVGIEGIWLHRHIRNGIYCWCSCVATWSTNKKCLLCTTPHLYIAVADLSMCPCHGTDNQSKYSLYANAIFVCLFFTNLTLILRRGLLLQPPVIFFLTTFWATM